MRAVWAAKKDGLFRQEAAQAIAKVIPRIRPGEIEQALRKVYDTHPTDGASPRPFGKTNASSQPTLKFSPDKLQALASKQDGFTIDDLRRKSPIDPATCCPTRFLRELSRPGECFIICTDVSERGDNNPWHHDDGQLQSDEHALDHIKYLQGHDGVVFMANPTDGQWRYSERHKKPSNPKGMTMRAEENVVSYRYLVIESDIAPMDLWIQAAVQFPYPIVSMTTSGGKSIHLLIRVEAANMQEWEAIKDKLSAVLLVLGADPAAMRPTQMTRLPGCYRASKLNMQELLYLNPHADGTPICQLPDRPTSASPTHQTLTPAHIS
jgi:hypothetical protein